MKDKLDYLKISLLKTLQIVPDDFALNEIKNHIRLAIVKLEEVERKRTKRELKSQKNKEQFVSVDPKQALKALENAIADEKDKLKKISKKQKEENHDEDELQSFFD